MTQETTWRRYLNDQERAELERAERERNAAADKLRALHKLLKNRCFARERRERAKEAK